MNMKEYDELLLKLKKNNPSLQIIDMNYELTKMLHPQAPMKISYTEFLCWVNENYLNVYKQYEYDYFNSLYHLDDHGEFLDWLHVQCYMLNKFPKTIFKKINAYVERNS